MRNYYYMKEQLSSKFGPNLEGNINQLLRVIDRDYCLTYVRNEQK